MSYSTDPATDADRYWSPRYAAADRYESALADATHDLFVLLVGDGTQEQAWTWPKPTAGRFDKYPSARDEFNDALDDPTKGFDKRVLEMLAAAARGESVQGNANRLLRDIAAHQAELAVEQTDFSGD